MIRWKGIATAVTITALTLSICGIVVAQQGWARLDTIKTSGPDAGINSVFYDGDEIWVVGARGLIARSHDDGGTFQEMHQGVDTGLNDVFVRRDLLRFILEDNFFRSRSRKPGNCRDASVIAGDRRYDLDSGFVLRTDVNRFRFTCRGQLYFGDPIEGLTVVIYDGDRIS